MCNCMASAPALGQTEYVTESAKSAQNTPIHFIISLFLCGLYNVSFIEFLRKYCVYYDEIFDKVLAMLGK